VAVSYVDRVLSPGERIAYRAGLHWILYLSAFGPTVAFVALVAVASQAPDGALRSILLLASSLALAISVLQILAVWIRIRNTEIVITDRRIIYKTGLISRRSIEMNLDKVESIVVDQGLLGRITDYGTVIIRGVGAGLEPVRYLAQPLAFRRQVNPG
jgi:uncharacterized membrane protein YdbT with pleckstrin-like domain